MQPQNRPIILFVVACVLFHSQLPVALAEEGLRFDLNGKQETILPLGYYSKAILGVKPDGYLLELKPTEIANPTVVPRFTPVSQSTMRGALMREFGRSFEVTGTGSFLIVHPQGKRDQWANRFEELHRSMLHFFKTRGFPMQRTKFPLVGIVFYSQSQYETYCRKVLHENASNTYGLYTPKSNRIYLFDATQGSGSNSAQWQENLATIMHEAAHQTAFNTGIHVRGAVTPAWVAEGIGCLFEARGIYNAFHYTNQSDRINHGRLNDYKSLVVQKAAEHIQAIVASDRAFRADPYSSYATAWALTYYLSERQQRDYVGYLRELAKYKPYEEYSASDRVRDFTKFFGKDFKMLATHLTRFLAENAST